MSIRIDVDYEIKPKSVCDTVSEVRGFSLGLSVYI